MTTRANIFFICGLPRSGTTAAIRGVRTFPMAYAIPYELAIPEILYRFKYITANPSFRPAFEAWLWRHLDQVIYRHDNDPDRHPYDGRLMELYKVWIERILSLTENLSDYHSAANTSSAFLDQVVREQSCHVLVEKTPSTALYIEQVRSLPMPISLITCVREPTAFLESCIRRSALSSQYERGGFEGGSIAFRDELIFYFSRIREALSGSGAYLLNHETLALSPRTACGFLYSILFGQCPDLGILNKFNDVVGGGSTHFPARSLRDYALCSSLFAELGYTCVSEPESSFLPPSTTLYDQIDLLYGTTQTPGAWIKVYERFQIALTRESCCSIEIHFLRDCNDKAIDDFHFKAVSCNQELPKIVKAEEDEAIVCVDVSSLGSCATHLISFEASSIIGHFLLGHCSEDFIFNIIVSISIR
jgi:hypothetical protein